MLDHVGIRYATTAPTGIAALNISGRTLHSWASMGLAQSRTADLYSKITATRNKNNWMGTQVLIIDGAGPTSPRPDSFRNLHGQPWSAPRLRGAVLTGQTSS